METFGILDFGVCDLERFSRSYIPTSQSFNFIEVGFGGEDWWGISYVQCLYLCWDENSDANLQNELLFEFSFDLTAICGPNSLSFFRLLNQVISLSERGDLLAPQCVLWNLYLV